jgi:hypothetical protein
MATPTGSAKRRKTGETPPEAEVPEEAKPSQLPEDIDEDEDSPPEPISRRLDLAPIKRDPYLEAIERGEDPMMVGQQARPAPVAQHSNPTIKSDPIGTPARARPVTTTNVIDLDSDSEPEPQPAEPQPSKKRKSDIMTSAPAPAASAAKTSTQPPRQLFATQSDIDDSPPGPEPGLLQQRQEEEGSSVAPTSQAELSSDDAPSSLFDIISQEY